MVIFEAKKQKHGVLLDLVYTDSESDTTSVLVLCPLLCPLSSSPLSSSPLSSYPPDDLDAEFYLCGPTGFMVDIRANLIARGVGADRIHSETFGPVGS